MLIFKYEKQQSARFISHRDLLRHMAKILRRAQIPVKFSAGFNPHELVYFSPPAVLGTSSVAEYVAVDADMDAGEAMERFNNATPNGLKASRVFVCAKNPNLQGVVVAADYVFDLPYAPIDLSNGFEICNPKNGNEVQNVADKIFDVHCVDGKLVMRIASGNVNLRPDRVLDALTKMFDTPSSLTKVVKIAQYVNGEGGLVCVDEFLQNQAMTNEVKG